MALDITAAWVAMTGAGYIESLKDGREVWLDGAPIDDLPSHPAFSGIVFSGIVNKLARIHAPQHTSQFRDRSTNHAGTVLPTTWRCPLPAWARKSTNTGRAATPTGTGQTCSGFTTNVRSGDGLRT